MRLDTAIDRANSVTTPKQAARLYNNIEYELALGEPTPEQERDGDKALSTLRSRFPGVEDAARDVTDPPETSRRAGRKLEHSGRPRRSAPSARGGSRRTASPAGGSAHSRPRPRSGNAAAGTPGQTRGAGGRAGAAAVTLASSAADSSWGELILDLFMWGAALSIGLLILTRAKAAGKLFEGATTAVRDLVSPTIDPLNPHGALAPGKSSSSSSTATLPHASVLPGAAFGAQTGVAIPGAAFGAETGTALSQSGAALAGALSNLARRTR